MTIGKRYLNVQ